MEINAYLAPLIMACFQLPHGIIFSVELLCNGTLGSKRNPFDFSHHKRRFCTMINCRQRSNATASYLLYPAMRLSHGNILLLSQFSPTSTEGSAFAMLLDPPCSWSHITFNWLRMSWLNSSSRRQYNAHCTVTHYLSLGKSPNLGKFHIHSSSSVYFTSFIWLQFFTIY